MAMPQGHLVAFCSDLGISRSVGALMLSVLLGTAFLQPADLGRDLRPHRRARHRADRLGLASLRDDGVSADARTKSDCSRSRPPSASAFPASSRLMCWRCANCFRRREASWRIPTLLLFSGFGMASGGWLAGLLYDHFGYYAPAFATGIGSNILNLVMVLVSASLAARQRCRAAYA